MSVFSSQSSSHESDAGLSHAKASLWLAALALLLYLPGFFSLQPMDRDEPRFAQATKQMLESGDLVAIRFQDEARNKKPVGIYWLQAGAVSAAQAVGVPEARAKIWIYRLPSLAAAIAATLLTYWAALAFVAAPEAFVAAALMAATILLGVEARLAKTDATVTASVVAAMGALARIWRGAPVGSETWRWPLIFWSAVALGVLVKGPITPMVPLLAAIVLAIRRRSLGWLAPLRAGWGLLLVAVVVAPWLTLILIKTQGAFLADSVGQDMLGKVAGGQEAHGAPPGTYLAAFWATAWPLAPFVGLALPFAWRSRGQEATLFLLAWAIPSWLVFEITPTKLPHYVLPLYPALSILAASAIQHGDEARGAWASLMRGWLIAVPVVLVVGVVAAAGYYGTLAEGAFSLSGLVGAALAVAAIGFAVSAARRQKADDATGAAARAAASSVALSALAFGFVMSGPLFKPFQMSPRLAQAGKAALAAASCPEAQGMATAGYREPSFVFLTRTDLRMTDGAGAAGELAFGPCRLVFVDKREEAGFLAARPGATPSSRVAGINLNGGRAMDVGVYVSGAAP
jgi:4-amino-4-deoxy-L-arabinose transferase-like glycosyltransferase